MNDKQEDFKIIQNLIGQACERSLVCNSLKIRFNCDIDKRGTSYIWIDPPWEFYLRAELITESLDAPEIEAKDYSNEFKKWSELFNPLNYTKLISATFTNERELELKFLDDFTLYMPYCPPDENEDNWYNHWYVRKNVINTSK